MKQFRLALDFDQTLALNWPDVDDPVPGAVEYTKLLKSDGHHLTLWSGRNNGNFSRLTRKRSIEGMQEFAAMHSIPYDDIDHGDQGKLIADYYIDDRALGVPLADYKGFKVVDWPLVYHMVRLLAGSDSI